MIKQLYTLILIAASTSFTCAQEYDQDYFSSPVNHKMRLSGSFAELRTNHFHMGIDIKSTNGRPGDPIIAAADGVISRINVDASGYGNVIYIDHDNGYTTVYAHLSAFADSIAAYIKREQYSTQRFQQQLYPDSLFYVEKGEVIGFMGNTGKSFGPHLHFEIRATKSETPVNPFLFGLKPTDNRPPVFQAIKFYESDSTGKLSLIFEKKINPVSKGIYALDEELISVPADEVAISVQVYDQMDGAYNKNGVYLMKLLVDDKVQHGYKLDKVSYDESHYINSFIDYEEKQNSKRQFSNCFTHPVDRLSIYEHRPDRNGKIALPDDSEKAIKIVLQDFHGNESILAFNVKSITPTASVERISGNYHLLNDQRNIVRLKNADLIFPKNSFVNNKELRITEASEIIDEQYLPSVSIGHKDIPLFKSYELHLKELSIPDSLKVHLCLLKCDSDSKTAHKGEWQDSLYVTELNDLGTYQCVLDMVAPKIIPINLKRNMSNESMIKLKITDNYKPSSKKQRLKYKGEIDGNWVLFEYDLKNDLIFYRFDNNCLPGEHKLVLTVDDHRGNESTFSYKFSNF